MYKVVGADRREYGPVSRETVLEWIAQGRANAQTIAKFENGAWKPLSTFDEFREALTVVGSEHPRLAAQGAPPEVTPGPGMFNDAPPFSGVGSRAGTNTASIIGIVAPLICCCCPLGPIVGLVASAIGLSQIQSNPNAYTTSATVPKIGLAISAGMMLLDIIGGLMHATIKEFVHSF